MKVLPMPAHATRHLNSEPVPVSYSTRLFLWLMRSLTFRSKLLRALCMPFVAVAMLSAELADVLVLAIAQFKFSTADGLWLRAYRVFIAFAVTMSIAIVGLSVIVLAKGSR